MMAEQLSNDLYDLIEHVELNKSGWWDSALRNVLLAAIWVEGKPVRRSEVRDLVISAFSVEIAADRVAETIDRLVVQGKLELTSDEHVCPASSVSKQMEARLKAAQQNELAVRAAFVKKVGKYCSPYSPENTWGLFNTELLLPLINALGARTIQLMSGDQTDNGDLAAITDNFVEHFDDTHRDVLRSAIGDFLDPTDVDVRRYVTEHLDTSFLIKASGLTKEAIAGISKFGNRPPVFSLFLDTNFLFSLLNLHENPSNEISQVLGKTIQQVSNHLSIKMYVISPTMDEIKRTLRASRADLSDIRMSPSLASAALEVGLSGIALRFARSNSEAAQPISPKEYFDPYLRDLTPILKGKGINVYNEQTEEYRQRQDVIDDLNGMIVAKGEHEAEQQRMYNAALHDSILWHFVNDKRPAVFESPLEAVYWVVTNDYRLINFDKRRQRTMTSAAGVCIHPAELVQILRLWEPRSTNMEQAMMSGLRLPFMFYEFDSGKEAVSLRILRALSRFEHIDSLGPETIRDIVLSDVIRSRTSRAANEEEEIKIIRDAMLAERQEISDQRDDAVRKARQTEEILAAERQATLDRIAAERNEREITDRRIVELQAELKNAWEEQSVIAEQVKGLTATLNKRDAQDRVRSARIRFALSRGLGVGMLGAALSACIGYAWTTIGAASASIVSASMFFAWVAAWFFILTTGAKDAKLGKWPPLQVLLSVRPAAIWVIGTLILAIVGNAIWQELIQPIWFN